jgi:hypothetical protein
MERVSKGGMVTALTPFSKTVTKTKIKIPIRKTFCKRGQSRHQVLFVTHLKPPVEPLQRVYRVFLRDVTCMMMRFFWKSGKWKGNVTILDMRPY